MGDVQKEVLKSRDKKKKKPHRHCNQNGHNCLVQSKDNYLDYL